MSHEASPHSSQAFIDLSQRNKDFIDPQTLSPEDPKKQVLYLIGNGHLDWVWYWQGDRGTSRAHHTFRSALNIMETNDEFTFTASSPLYYQKIQRQDPGMFREIQGRVKENRWGVVGGGWVEPDMNLPSGESFATQFRLTQRYFSEQLGVTPTVALAADAFGHDGTLPQLLKESGYDFYMHMRPQQNEKDLPLGMYRWMMKGTDTGVDAERIFEEYTTGINTTNDHIRRAAQAIDKRLPALSVWYGVGNHGGGPTRDVLKRIEELKQDKDLPQLVFSTPEEYYALVRPTYDQLPVESGELQWHASGAYSAHAENNKRERKTEARKETARSLAALSHWYTGSTYPKKEFEKADQTHAAQQFHDIRAGSSIHAAYIDAAHALGGVVAQADEAISDAVQSLTAEMDIPLEPHTTPYVVFNSLGFPRDSYIEIEENDLSGNLTLEDGTGVLLPHQEVTPDVISGVGERKRRKVGTIVSLPSFGATLIKLRSNQEDVQPAETVPHSETVLENSAVRIAFNQKSGEIEEFFDKKLGYDFIYRDHGGERFQFGVPVIAADTFQGKPIDTWGHSMYQWRPTAKEDVTYISDSQKYTRPEYNGFTLSSPFEIIESGPVKTSIRGEWRYPGMGDQASLLTQTYTLFADNPMLLVDNNLDWHSPHEMLKILFTVGIEARNIAAEAAYGRVSRGENGTEYPMQRFIDISGRRRDKHEGAGLTFLTDSISSYSVDERRLGLTVLRSPHIAHHDPTVIDPSTTHAHANIGEHRFRYAIIPHNGENPDAVKQAAAFTQPPIIIMETERTKRLSPHLSLLNTEADNVYLTAMKGSEDKEGIVFRVQETAGKRGPVTISVDDKTKHITLPLKPYEVITVRMTKTGAYEIVDIPEQKVKKEYEV